MARSNAEIVLQAFPLFEAEEWEATAQLWHPDGRVTAPEGWPEPGPFEGRDAVIGQFKRLASDMGTHRFRDVELLADRGGWVVASFVWEVEGAGSGAATASNMAAAYRVEDGTLREAHFRWTPDEAFKAAGLAA